MTFNKPPEWGSRFQFPENQKIDFDYLQMRVTDKIVVQMLDNYETAVAAEIASAARAAGASDVTVLNKEAIMAALSKQIPKKPIRDSLADRACPACYAYIPFDALNDDIADAPKFCKECGQALDWGTDNDNKSGID